MNVAELREHLDALSRDGNDATPVCVMAGNYETSVIEVRDTTGTDGQPIVLLRTVYD